MGEGKLDVSLQANSPFVGAVRSHARAARERMCECMQGVGGSLASSLQLALHTTQNYELTDDQGRIILLECYKVKLPRNTWHF